MGNEVDFSSKTTEDSIVRAVLYLRLSDEDRNKATNNDWSESIKNQEVMLRKYALENGWKIVGVYNDEDYSGSDRKRPNFNKMIKECALGNVDVVLVKTQARFSRDIELIDKYVHNKFKEWKVRFITLLEKIDNTKRETKKTSQIMGMIDEWYVEDTSINIRETFRIKREKGQFTGSFAPYGYKRDPENKNHLLIDPIPALIIERIYQEYAKGFGIGRIVAGLTRDSILSPLEYKMLNDCKLKIPIVKNEFDAAIVKKTGSYIVKSSFYNDTRQVLKDLITISVVMNGEKDSFDKFKIRVHKVSKQKVKLFYAIKDFKALKIEVDENNELILTHLNFDNDDWYSLSKGDMIPKNATCIALYVNKLDRTHEVNYELELELKENKEQREFFIKTFGLLNNLERPVRFVTQIRNKYNWSEQTVKKILRDEVYIGNLLQYKTTYVSYKNHKVVYNPKQDWIRYDKAHEAIIEKSLWDDVQNRQHLRKKACKNGKAHLLANKVFCASCQGKFCKCGKNDTKGMAYLCCRDKLNRWVNCDNKKYIKESELHEFVIAKFNELLKRFYREELQLKFYTDMILKDFFKDRVIVLKKEQLELQNELKKKNFYFQRLYEDRLRGILDDDEYMMLKNNYKKTCDNLKNRILIIEQELMKLHLNQEKLKDRQFFLKKYKQISTLNSEIVNKFIAGIQIGKFNDKTKSREIKIVWNFSD